MLALQLQELVQDEGEQLFVYDDATGRKIIPGSIVEGHPTIGIGRCLDTHGITTQESQVLLTNDIASCEKQLLELPWYQALSDVRKGVMVNLCFNLGFAGLLEFKRMIADLQAGYFGSAAEELRTSRWANEVQQSRVNRLVKQLQTGQIDNAYDGAPR